MASGREQALLLRTELQLHRAVSPTTQPAARDTQLPAASQLNMQAKQRSMASGREQALLLRTELQLHRAVSPTTQPAARDTPLPAASQLNMQAEQTTPRPMP